MSRAGDRCPNCRGPLKFEGIDTAHGHWVRWAGCPACESPSGTTGVWVLSDEVGSVLGVSTVPPAKNQFLTGKALLNAVRADKQAQRVEEYL